MNRVFKDKTQASSPQSSRMRGLYYIGTFEQRPGSATDYTVADPLYPAGSSQGDGPQGTLTSDVFIIYGTTISFLIGGGCDYYLEYVELLIDGLSVSKVTGKCEERMRKVSFDTTFLQLRAAQIRIVDASSGNWGHINVDEIKFNWQIRGGILNDSLVGAGFNGKETAGGNVETPHSGVVYTFLQHVTNNDNICKFDTTICSWRQERKLGASDKRQNTFFGSAIAINDEVNKCISNNY